MGRISHEDKMRIQTPHEQGLGAKAIRSRYPAKQWSLNTLKTICRHITKTGSVVTRQSGSRRPKSARTAQNIAAVGDMICSQEDQPGTSKSSCQIAKTLGMSDRSVRCIAKMDLELSAFRRMRAQVLSDAVKLKQLEQCRALLRRLTVNKVKQVFFIDEKNFYLNPPVSKSVCYFINFYSSWKFCLHLRCCNRDIHGCWVAKSHFQVQKAVTFSTFEFFNTIFRISCNTYWQ